MTGELDPTLPGGDPYRLRELRAQGTWVVWHVVYDGIGEDVVGLIAQRIWAGTPYVDHLHLIGTRMALARRELVVEDDSDTVTTTVPEWQRAGPLVDIVAELLDLRPPDVDVFVVDVDQTPGPSVRDVGPGRAGASPISISPGEAPPTTTSSTGDAD